jgi:hypothetical protein
MGHDWQTALPDCLFPLIGTAGFTTRESNLPPSLMTSGTPASQPDHEAVIDDWCTISEELLQGLVHALNNRVAALSAFVELARLGDEEGDPLAVLPTEIAQLHRVNALFGLLPERKADAEALDLRAVLDDAVLLHQHHPRLRGERVAISFEGAPGAVRAPRWALVRTMVMLLHAAKRPGESAREHGDAALRVRGDETSVSVRVATAAWPSADLVAYVERCSGQVTRTNDELVLTLPSLRELRRREHEARGEAAPS